LSQGFSSRTHVYTHSHCQIPTVMTASTKNTATEATTGGTKKAAFATPDRDHHPNVVAPSSASSIHNEATPAGGEMQTVTPPTPNGKQVRFDKDNVNGVVSSKRGVVSRRGGRYGSPSRTSAPAAMMAAPAAPVEYNKAYRSPKREETSSDGGVPSLCSAHSEALGEAPSMISCSEGETTSPLTEMSPSKKPKPESRNVTFSPRPTEVASAEKVSVKQFFPCEFVDIPCVISPHPVPLVVCSSLILQPRRVRKPRQGPLPIITFTICHLYEMPNSVRLVVFFYHHVHPRLPPMRRLRDHPELDLKKKNHPRLKVKNGNEHWQRRRTLQ
jgi:hypothetical protein